MKRYLKTRDIQQRYSCSPGTARKYMRQMEHSENPLMVTEAAADAWDRDRTYGPGETISQPRRKHTAKHAPGDYRIPRVRPA